MFIERSRKIIKGNYFIRKRFFCHFSSVFEIFHYLDCSPYLCRAFFWVSPHLVITPKTPVVVISFQKTYRLQIFGNSKEILQVQRRSQDPCRRLRWRVLQQQFTDFSDNYCCKVLYLICLQGSWLRLWISRHSQNKTIIKIFQKCPWNFPLGF